MDREPWVNERFMSGWKVKWIVLQGDYAEKWYVKLFTVTSIKAVKCIILSLLFDSPSYMVNHLGNAAQLLSYVHIS